MGISSGAIRIAFLLLPGLLASKVYRKFRGRTGKKKWEDLAEVLIFATASYLILALMFMCCQACRSFLGDPCNSAQADQSAAAQTSAKPETSPLGGLLDEKVSVDFLEVAGGVAVGIVLGIGAGYAHTHKVLMRFGRLIRATNRTGDEDVWDAFFTSDDVGWVYVRDHKADLVYSGAVTEFSDSGAARELLIEEVSVYNSDGDHLYEAPALYISRKPEDITIETIPERTIL